jgi:uncharacterized protein
MSQAGVIDGLQFARGGLEVGGVLGMEKLRRLAEMQGSTDGLEYRVRGGINDDANPCLRISVSGEVQLTCQRCLGPLTVPLATDAELVLSESEREIQQAEDEVDRVLASRAMDVAQLVEDEVILALPMIARHEDCAPAQDVPTSELRPSPFNVLAGLKGRRRP